MGENEHGDSTVKLFSEAGPEQKIHFAEMFRAILDCSPVAVMLKDARGRCLYGNSLLERIVETHNWLGKTDDQLFRPEKASRMRSATDETLRTGSPVAITLPCDEPNEAKSWWKVIHFCAVCADNRERVVGVVAVDVTDQRRVEEEVVEISEREQRRMGRDLHDGLCQHLSGLCLMSQALQDRLERERSPEAAQARTITRFLRKGVELARDLIRNYHATNIEKGGMLAALEEFTATTAQLFNIPIDLIVESEPGEIPDQNMAVQLFRIVQEAVHNALKHADANHVSVVIGRKDNHLFLEVRDDGRGFPAERSAVSGLGMNTMRYRADLIGGRLEFDSQEGKGVKVQCIVPIEPLSHKG